MGSPSRPRLLAFAQLLRLPNVFTAFSDIALAAAVGVAVLTEWPGGSFWLRVGLLALASGCLYLGGMVWNDVFDRAEDAKTRAFRPLPSGRVTVRTAVVLGTLLLAAGVGFAALSGLPRSAEWDANPIVLACNLAVMILLYDGWLKHYPVGPVAMAMCRFLNVLLGLTAIPETVLPIAVRVHVAGVVGIYIVGVTWFARTEEGTSRRRHLIAAAVVIGAALVLALVLRAKRPPGLGFGAFLFPYLLVGFAFLIGLPIARAVRRPSSREVQAAVKRCVLGLIVLDAVLATAFVGVPGLLIVLLLPPALLIGKWVYST